MKIEEVIKKSIEGGYTAYAMNVAKNQIPIQDAVDAFFRDSTIEKAVLDPTFWSCLGKSMGWDQPIWKCEYYNPKANEPGQRGCDNEFCGHAGWRDWKDVWHSLVDHLIEGKSVADFFKNL